MYLKRNCVFKYKLQSSDKVMSRTSTVIHHLLIASSEQGTLSVWIVIRFATSDDVIRYFLQPLMLMTKALHLYRLNILYFCRNAFFTITNVPIRISQCRKFVARG